MANDCWTVPVRYVIHFIKAVYSRNADNCLPSTTIRWPQNQCRFTVSQSDSLHLPPFSSRMGTLSRPVTGTNIKPSKPDRVVKKKYQEKVVKSRSFLSYSTEIDKLCRYRVRWSRTHNIGFHPVNNMSFNPLTRQATRTKGIPCTPRRQLHTEPRQVSSRTILHPHCPLNQHRALKAKVIILFHTHLQARTSARAIMDTTGPGEHFLMTRKKWMEKATRPHCL